MAFPQTRMRRLRASASLRGLVRETHLDAGDLILPLFVGEQRQPRERIEAMPGVDRLSLAEAVAEASAAAQLGLGGLLLFGIPAEKDAEGTSAYDEDGIVQLACRAIKQTVPDLLLITDVCLCEYTDHGHCGVLRPSVAGADHAVGVGVGVGAGAVVDNDATLQLLARTAVSHALAGADVVAPSDMMDGRVAAIRSALDEEGLQDTPILSYSTKFASAFYGPFRDAAGSAPAFGDRRGYQLDPANARQALREALLDVEEGADMLMVKPALGYGDLIARVRAATELPIAAYNVSGEYAMVKAAAAAGYLEERATVLEILTSLRRAGADALITYHAKEAARWLSETN